LKDIEYQAWQTGIVSLQLTYVNMHCPFQISILFNKPIMSAVLLTLFLQLPITYWEPTRGVFGTQRLSLTDSLLSLVTSTLVIWAVEFKKLLKRRKMGIILLPLNNNSLDKCN
jgi:hypothetical protein